MVMVVGVDVHKRTHTAVVVDEVGRSVAERTVRATDAGHRQLLRWVLGQTGGRVEFAVEDCRHVSTRLERALLDAGQVVLRVPPKLMAGARSSTRTPGKSDPIDALAIARAALREPDLPRAEHSPVTREMKLLVDHREALVGTRTQLQNRLRWHLHELDPELDLPRGGLDRAAVLDVVRSRLGELPPSILTRLAGELVEDIAALTVRVRDLEREIAALARQHAPQLLELPGCGPLTAAKIVGETANPTRFASEARWAMHAGVAPIPASSGQTTRHRLARGGNRQLNAALHRIAITQIRLDGPGKTYYQHRRSHGDSPKEALRALKRRIARTVFTRLRDPQPTHLKAAA